MANPTLENYIHIYNQATAEILTHLNFYYSYGGHFFNQWKLAGSAPDPGTAPDHRRRRYRSKRKKKKISYHDIDIDHRRNQ